MANHGLRHLAGLPIGQMRPRNAGLGRVAPLEVGVRATISPTHRYLRRPKIRPAGLRRSRSSSPGWLTVLTSCVLAKPC